MTSLRAIFTGRKRISLFLLVFALSLSSLFAESYSYALLSENDGYREILSEVLTLFGEVRNQDRIDEVKGRLILESEYSYDRSYDSYLKSEDFDSIESLSKADVDFSSLSLSESSHAFSDSERDLIFSEEEAIEYYKRLYSLDMIISVKEVSSDPIPLLEVSVDGERVLGTYYESLERERQIKELIGIFLTLFEDESTHVYSFELPQSGKLEVDGEDVLLDLGYVALEDGEHEFSYSAPGYISDSMRLTLDGSSDRIDFSLTPIAPRALLVTPIPYDARVFYNGIEEEDHIIDDAIYPFTVTLSHEGFGVYSLQSMERLISVGMTMKPIWMTGYNLLSDAKGEFYKSLFTTLALFGGYVASGVVSRVYSDVPELYPMTGVTLGMSVVSLVNLVQSIFEYYESAQLGI